MSPEEDRTRDPVDSEPKHYQLSYSGPPMKAYELNREKIEKVTTFKYFGQTTPPKETTKEEIYAKTRACSMELI